MLEALSLSKDPMKFAALFEDDPAAASARSKHMAPLDLAVPPHTQGCLNGVPASWRALAGNTWSFVAPAGSTHGQV
jgi:hypothetical protein